MALSTEKRRLKHLFIGANKKTPEAEKVQKYLQEVHGIKTPENLASKLTQANREFRGSPFNMSLSLVDAIVEACEHWHDYVVDWDDLVCKEVLSMARIHTSVVWLRSLEKDGFSLKKQPSFYMETTVTHDGIVRFCNR